MTDPAFLQLDPFGPADMGLTRRPPYPREGLETEPPVHSSHLYIDDAAAAIKIGVWECTPQRSKMQPFGVTEFMVLLEGSVTLAEPDDVTTTLRAGEAFLIPQGVLCQWRQAEPVRKFFAIRSRPAGHEPPAGAHVLNAQPGAAAAARSDAATELPFSAAPMLYADPASGMSLARLNGVHPVQQTLTPRAYHLLRVEAGELGLSEQGGGHIMAGLGAVLLIKPGTPILWEGSANLCLLACRIEP